MNSPDLTCFHYLPTITNKSLNHSGIILHTSFVAPKSHLPYDIWTFIQAHIMPDVRFSLLLHFVLIGDFFQRHFNTNQCQHSTRPIQLLRSQFYCHQYPPRLSNTFISCEFIWLYCKLKLGLVGSSQIMAVSSSSHFVFALFYGEWSVPKINFVFVNHKHISDMCLWHTNFQSQRGWLSGMEMDLYKALSIGSKKSEFGLSRRLKFPKL